MNPLELEFTYRYVNNDTIESETLHGYDVYKCIPPRPVVSSAKKDDCDDEKFERFEKWLLDNGAVFPHVQLYSMSGSMRGVYMRDEVERGTPIVSIPSKLFISCDMGIDAPLSEGLKSENLGFEKCKHLYLSNFLLEDMDNEKSFYKPYYDTLPEDISNIPLMWTNKELNDMKGSYFFSVIRSRVVDIYADYQKMCDVDPLFCRFTFDKYLRIRVLIGSRNFGSVYHNLNNGILVPLADMLNHNCPRQTSWEYKADQDAFVITSLTKLFAGDQVFDSYGRKDNRRQFFCYGFVVDDNLDGNLCSPNTVAIAVLPSHPELIDMATTAAECVLSSSALTPLDENKNCLFFWNSIVIEVMNTAIGAVKPLTLNEQETNSKEPEDDDAVCFALSNETISPAIAPSTKETLDATMCFGSVLRRRTEFITQSSSVFANNTVTFDDTLVYDHSQSSYVYLSMSCDDAGTTTLFGMLRLLLATDEEFETIRAIKLPRVTNDVFLLLRNSLSLSNEYLVLKTLAQISRIRMACYERSFEDNASILSDVTVPLYTNRRNAVAMIRSEQQIFLHYILLFEYVKNLMKRTIEEQMKTVSDLMDKQHCLYDYLQSVWLPVLQHEIAIDICPPIPEENEYQKNAIEFFIRLNMKGINKYDGFVDI